MTLVLPQVLELSLPTPVYETLVFFSPAGGASDSPTMVIAGFRIHINPHLILPGLRNEGHFPTRGTGPKGTPVAAR